MYQYSYAEVLEDDQTAARRTEAQALDRAVTLLMAADAVPHPSRQGVDALYVTCQLWMALITELAAPDNALPNQIRANLHRHLGLEGGGRDPARVVDQLRRHRRRLRHHPRRLALIHPPACRAHRPIPSIET